MALVEMLAEPTNRCIPNRALKAQRARLGTAALASVVITVLLGQHPELVMLAVQLGWQLGYS